MELKGRGGLLPGVWAHTDHLPFKEQEASGRGPRGFHLPGSLAFGSFLIGEGGEETVLGVY